MAKSEWHFPREDFASEIFHLLTESPASAISMFGPRRTGKTEFLLRDLVPFADRLNHRVLYVNMWQSTNKPIASILYAFDQELRGKTLMDRIASAAIDLAPKIKLKDPVTGSEIEVDTANLMANSQIDPAFLLDQYCDRLADDDRPTLLLFDEFQEIVRHENTSSIVAGLRTSLDKRKYGLVSIFTGSSQEGLIKVFNARSAPFFRFATEMPLPTLDETFVDYQLEIFHSKVNRVIERKDALSVFKRVDQNPMFFHLWLIALMAQSSLTPNAAVDHVLKNLGEQFHYDKYWKKLKPLQRAVLRLLAMDMENIYSDESSEKLEKLTTKSKPENVNIQNAIRRLSRMEIIENYGDVWRVNDPLLKAWVKDQPNSDFQ